MNSLLTTLAVLVLVPVVHTSALVFGHPVTPPQLQTLIEPAAQELAKNPVLRGGFTQKKFLKDIPKPLQSSGSFIVARGQGIYWHTRLPFDSEFILTPDRMVQLDGGNTAVRLNTAQQPGLRVVGDIFFSIFALNPDALARNFQLFGKAGKRGTWLLGLRPKNAALNGVLSEAVIAGATRVQNVQLWDAHGDRTEIMMTVSKTNANALTPTEAKLFQQ